VRLHDAVQKALANKHNVLAVFIDIENACDMVNKTVLLSKLLALGINGEMLRFIQSFLSRRTFQVRVGSSLSGIKESENGTPQGSILSPLLFSVLINDVSRHVFSPSALLADDFCFWESGSDIQLLEARCLHQKLPHGAYILASEFRHRNRRPSCSPESANHQR